MQLIGMDKSGNYQFKDTAGDVKTHDIPASRATHDTIVNAKKKPSEVDKTYKDITTEVNGSTEAATEFIYDSGFMLYFVKRKIIGSNFHIYGY